MTTSSEQPLKGKVALVTGASSGIGKATALMLAQNGADVAINYLTLPEGAEEVAGQVRALGRKAELYQVDVSDLEAVEEMADAIVKNLGRLDVYVSSAVYSDRENFHEADMAGFRRTIDVTMWGAFNGLRASARRMIEQGDGGSAVVVSSPHAQIARPRCMAYNMAKGAVDQMARTAALELAEHGIRVNIVSAGWANTPGERKYYTEEKIQRGGDKLPIRRLAEPEEIARAVLFLVDPASSYITGSTYAVDGGAMLPWWAPHVREV